MAQDEQQDSNLPLRIPSELLCELDRIGRLEDQTKELQAIQFLTESVKRYNDARRNTGLPPNDAGSY